MEVTVYNIDTLENINNILSVEFVYPISTTFSVYVKKTLIKNVFWINNILCDFNKYSVINQIDENGNIVNKIQLTDEEMIQWITNITITEEEND